MTTWLGVDVGAPRKGFDVAVVDERRLIALRGGLSCGGVVELVDAHRPTLAGIDSPRSCAAPGETVRTCEREVARAVCAIRWTPERARLDGNPYYSWIVAGLELFSELQRRGVAAIEVFPTASWTRWRGPRGGTSRARWSRAGLGALGLEDVPTQTNQDQRDAIAAAVTAREHTRGLTETFGGEIVVPI